MVRAQSRSCASQAPRAFVLRSCASARVGSVWVGTGLARRHVALRAVAQVPATSAGRLRAAADALPADARPDRYGGGDVVEGFERRVPDLLGKDAAPMPPSLTMAQQIALRLHCDLCGLRTVAFHPTERAGTAVSSRSVSLRSPTHACSTGLPRGRAWFEHTLPDRLTLGRPDEMAIVFERRVSRRTPRRFSDQGLQRRYGAAIQIHVPRLEGQAVLEGGVRSGPRRPSTTLASSGSAGCSPRTLGLGDRYRPQDQPAAPSPPAQGVPMRARRHYAPTVVQTSIEDGLPAPGLRFGEPRIKRWFALARARSLEVAPPGVGGC